MKKEIQTNNAPSPIGPYSQAILYNNMLFISGQIAINPSTGNIITNSIEKETHQVMNNIKAILEEAEFELKNIVKCSIFISDMKKFSKINKVYGSYFKSPYPSRETVEVSCLPKNVNVEISVIAAKKNKIKN